MKNKRNSLLALSMTLLVLSCKKNTSVDTKPINQQSIIGKWTVINMTVSLLNNHTKQTITNQFNESVAKMQWEFKADGNLYTQTGKVLNTVPYQLADASRIILNYKKTSDTLEVNVHLNKATLLEKKALPNGNVSTTTLELAQ